MNCDSGSDNDNDNDNDNGNNNSNGNDNDQLIDKSDLILKHKIEMKIITLVSRNKLGQLRTILDMLMMTADQSDSKSTKSKIENILSLENAFQVSIGNHRNSEDNYNNHKRPKQSIDTDNEESATETVTQQINYGGETDVSTTTSKLNRPVPTTGPANAPLPMVCVVICFFSFPFSFFCF